MLSPSPSPGHNHFLAISAEEYATFKKKVLEAELKTHKTGIALAPSDTECKSIEVMCSGLSVAILEIFAGRRPAHHIAKWLSKGCYNKILNRSKITKQTMRRKYAHLPLSQTPFRKDLRLPKTRRARAQKINDTTFEVCLIVEDYSRVRAMALRVEKIFTAWKITAIEIA